MTAQYSDFLRYLTVSSVLIYFVFSFFDGRAVKDEREELIRLKTFELVQKLTMWSLTVLAVAIFFEPQMLASITIMILVLMSMYGEIAAKTYFRRTL